MFSIRVRTFLATVLLVLAISVVPSFGQVSYYGAIRGIIHDPSGAVVPNAKITATDERQNTSRTTTTSAGGEYAFAEVTPSTYTITVEATGFKKLERKGVIVDTQAQIGLDLALEVGAVTQAVEVTAAAPMIETANASVGQAINEQKIEELPNVGRNALIMAKLAQNVIFTGNPVMNRMQDQGSTANVSIAGSVGWSGNWLIDGIPETDWDNRPILIASIEAVDEVKVMYNTYDAEMGRNAGFVVNTTLKSGTNALHGALFGAIRRNSMDANQFFNNATTPVTALTPIPNDNWAGNMGGPVIIPHLYDGRNKTFWFVAYEGYNNGTAYSGTFYQPTALERVGDFSQTKADAAGDPLLLYDPTTTNIATGARQTFLSEYGKNAIPQGMINPVGLAAAGYFPSPSTAPGYYGETDSTSATTSFSVGRQYVIKADEQFTNWWRASGSFMKCWTVEPGPGWFGGPAAQSGWALWRLEDLTAINNTITISPTTVLAVRYGYNRFPNQYYDITAIHGWDPAQLGFPSSLVSQMQYLSFPAFNMSTAYSMGTPSDNYYNWYSNNLSAMVSHIHGRHSLKTGFDFRRLAVTGLDYSNAFGSYTFNGIFTQATPTSTYQPGTQIVTGADVADLLLGYPQSGQIEKTVQLTDYEHYYGAFVQDDIRVNNRLTINAGLRWEHEPGFREIQNRLYTNFDETAVNPAANYMNPANTPAGFVPHGVVQWAGQAGAPFSAGNPELEKLGPRLGAAYKINDKTVLRGGFALMWGPPNQLGSPYSPAGFAAYTPYIASVNGFATSAGSLSNPFPTGILQPVGFGPGSLTGIGQSINVYDPQSRNTRVTEYSVDLQRELPFGVSLTVAYLGTLGRNLWWDINQNVLNPTYFNMGPTPAAAYAALTATVPNPFYGNSAVAQGVLASPTVPESQLLLPYPTYSGVTFNQTPLNQSHYDSGVIRVQKRMGNGLTFLTNVTWMKSTDYNSGPTNLMSGGRGLQNPYNILAEKGLSEFNVPVLWNLGMTYQLPFGKGKPFASNSTALDYVVGGWQFNGTAIVRSGFPAPIYQTNYNGGFGYSSQRPNATGITPQTNGSLESRLGGIYSSTAYYNIAAFQTVGPLQFGNLGGMIPARGPGTRVLTCHSSRP